MRRGVDGGADGLSVQAEAHGGLTEVVGHGPMEILTV